MTEFSLFAESGCTGHYESARVIAITVHERATKRTTLVFLRICMRPSDAIQLEPNNSFNDLSKEYGYGITEYDVDLPTAKSIYEHLKKGENSLTLSGYTLYTDKDKEMLSKYTGPQLGNRENAFLEKMPNGSHWIEFFNEDKRSVALIYDSSGKSLLDKMAAEVEKKAGINLVNAQDRLGNVIFQFPVTAVDVKIEGAPTGAKVNIQWNLPESAIPLAYIHAIAQDENSIVDYTLDRNMGNAIQILQLHIFDPNLKIRLFRKDPDLVLHEWQCDCGQITHIYGTFANDKPTVRTFNADGTRHRITLFWPNDAFNPIHHSYHTQMAIARSTSKPAYRQYERNQYKEAMEYLRELVKTRKSREILVIDPFLRAQDITNVAYFSPMFGRTIRAIGSTSADIEKKLQSSEIVAAPKIAPGGNKSIKQIIEDQQNILQNPDNSNLGITLEFRLQHGKHGIKIHDRFLLFPGYPPDHAEPAAYSIGTSFNGVGESYHVIGSLQGPQEIIDNFEKQWGQLAHPDCLIYKT